MSTTKSDLIDKVHHEHQHLALMFDDIRSTFEKLKAGELEPGSRSEIFESAAEDLRVGLDEMLHHFDQEEEVFFVEIERRFPELSEEIQNLVATHERMCTRTKDLKAIVSSDPDTMERHADEAFSMIRELQETLMAHTHDENEIFSKALKRMQPQERRKLLDEMQKI